MNSFSFTVARNTEGAVTEIGINPSAKFIAGGTNLLDLMKENVARPAHLIDIKNSISAHSTINRSIARIYDVPMSRSLALR